MDFEKLIELFRLYAESDEDTKALVEQILKSSQSCAERPLERQRE